MNDYGIFDQYFFNCEKNSLQNDQDDLQCIQKYITVNAHTVYPGPIAKRRGDI